MRSVAFVALVNVGCSLGDFGYLSAEFGAGHAGASGDADASHGGDGGTSGGGNGGAGGSLSTAGNAAAGTAGAAGSSGGNGSSGGGTDIGNEFFCDPKYAVFAPAAGGAPPVRLPETGNYVLRRQASTPTCLIAPDWPELEEHRYSAITHDCGTADALNPTVDDVWQIEHVCSDVYRFITHHGTDAERQLAIKAQTEFGTPLYSVPYIASQPNDDPAMLFHLRFEELAGTVVRWRFSPVIQSSSCVEETGQAHYGQLDVSPVVLYPCTGNLANQSWNFLPAP